MPNHILNEITFGTDEKSLAAFARMLEDVKADGEPLGSIDFNKLVPMPPGLDGESANANGIPVWYNWSIQNWGTKWNAYQCVPQEKGSDAILFLTASTPVPEILKALSRKYPDQVIHYRWAGENIGCTVGEARYQNGKCIELHIPEDESRTACELAANIHGIHPSDIEQFCSGRREKQESRGQLR